MLGPPPNQEISESFLLQLPRYKVLEFIHMPRKILPNSFKINLYQPIYPEELIQKIFEIVSIRLHGISIVI